MNRPICSLALAAALAAAVAQAQAPAFCHAHDPADPGYDINDYDQLRDADDWCKLAQHEPHKARRQLSKAVSLVRQANNPNRFYFDPKRGSAQGLYIQLLRPWMKTEEGADWRVVQGNGAWWHDGRHTHGRFDKANRPTDHSDHSLLLEALIVDFADLENPRRRIYVSIRYHDPHYKLYALSPGMVSLPYTEWIVASLYMHCERRSRQRPPQHRYGSTAPYGFTAEQVRDDIHYALDAGYDPAKKRLAIDRCRSS